MRVLLALVAAVAVSGSVASAAPSHHHKKKHEHHKRQPEDAVAFAAEPDAPAPVDDLVEVHVKRHPLVHHDWNLAVGPYLWASAVDANVSLGQANVASSIDFLQTTQHAKYGAELLADARFGRVSFSGDLQYGVVGIGGGNSAGPLMVTVNGTAASLLVDGFAGYRIAGDEHSLFAFDARGGVRYQRIAIQSAVDIDGTPVAQPGTIDAGRDFLAAGRLFIRPSSRFYVTAAGDVGVVGTSNTTWSASADASLKVTSHVLLSLGYRTLTIERANVQLVMHGPRAALQLLF